MAVSYAKMLAGPAAEFRAVRKPPLERCIGEGITSDKQLKAVRGYDRAGGLRVVVSAGRELER